MLENKIDERKKAELLASFWETRKVRGIMALFYLGHNMACDMLASKYRSRLKKFPSGR